MVSLTGKRSGMARSASDTEPAGRSSVTDRKSAGATTRTTARTPHTVTAPSLRRHSLAADPESTQSHQLQQPASTPAVISLPQQRCRQRQTSATWHILQTHNNNTLRFDRLLREFLTSALHDSSLLRTAHFQQLDHDSEDVQSASSLTNMS